MMKRTLPRLLGVLAFAVLTNGGPVTAAAIQTPVNTATSGFPVVIAVLADHYTDEQEFNLDVQNFITNGLLMHPYYASHKADLEIVSFYEPLKAGTQSNYGFNVEAPSGYCAMSWTVSNDDSNTATAIDLVVGGISPKHTIVIGDHPYNIGCTEGSWTYVATDAVGTDVLSHELGHALANLYDEWFFQSNANVPHPGIPANMTRNCYDTRHGPRPPWMPPASASTTATSAFPGAGSIAGCDFFGLAVVHGYPPHLNGKNYCLMGATHGADFCPICHAYMQQAFDPPNPDTDNPGIQNPRLDNPDTQNPSRPSPPTNLRSVKVAYVQPAPTPPQPPPGAALKPVPPRPIVRLIASFDPGNGRLTPKKGIPVTARYVPDQRRLGEYAYLIVVNGQRHAGVIPSNLFRSRTYQGGVAHQSSDAHETDITIQIPDVTSDMVKNGTVNLSITIYRLGPTVTQSVITPAVLADLIGSGRAEQRGAAVTAKDLLSVM